MTNLRNGLKSGGICGVRLVLTWILECRASERTDVSVSLVVTVNKQRKRKLHRTTYNKKY
jgi:hypothetical protein